jgi:cell pole-organizing protein PopZ
MSKADPTSESLESILASIRKSLAEQSTDILNEDAAAAAEAPYELQPSMPGEDDMPRLFGGAGASAPAAGAALRDGLSGRVLEDFPPPSPPDAAPPYPAAPVRPVDDPPPPAPAALGAAPTPAQAPKDALWFLGRNDAAADRKAVQPPAPRAPMQPAAEAKPIRTEIVRGPLPPFFGSSAEAAKVEVAPIPEVPPAASVMPPVPPPPVPPPAAARGPADDPLVSPAPGTATGPATHSLAGMRAGAGAVSREGAPNGKAASFLGHPATDGRVAATDSSPQFQGLQGLEAMVAELLRPMLRRWLDENMPRLVSAALKAEAELMARRDPKKP